MVSAHLLPVRLPCHRGDRLRRRQGLTLRRRDRSRRRPDPMPRRGDRLRLKPDQRRRMAAGAFLAAVAADPYPTAVVADPYLTAVVAAETTVEAETTVVVADQDDELLRSICRRGL